MKIRAAVIEVVKIVKQCNVKEVNGGHRRMEIFILISSNMGSQYCTDSNEQMNVQSCVACSMTFRSMTDCIYDGGNII